MAFWEDWSDGKKWFMGILSALIIATAIGVVRLITGQVGLPEGQPAHEETLLAYDVEIWYEEDVDPELVLALEERLEGGGAAVRLREFLPHDSDLYQVQSHGSSVFYESINEYEMAASASKFVSDLKKLAIAKSPLDDYNEVWIFLRDD